MHPYVTRGKGRPGRNKRQVDRDPVIASGMYKLETSQAPLPVEFIPPADAKPEDQTRSDFVERNLRNWLRSGLPGLLVETVGGGFQDGFYLAELAFDVIENTSGLIGLTQSMKIEPWQVVRWVDDANGIPEGVVVEDSERNKVTVPSWKYFHWGRRFTGRNPEGESGLRTTWYGGELKRQALLRTALSRERFGPGTRVYKISDDGGTVDQDALMNMDNEFHKGTTSRLVVPPHVSFDLLHGGSVLPDESELIRLIDQQNSRALDDNLPGMGTAQYGSRATSESLRVESDRTAEGLAVLIAIAITRQLVHRIFEFNGWDIARAPSVKIGGFTESNQWRAMMEVYRELPETAQGDLVPDIVRKFRSDFLQGSF
jgi:hypothetical protein